MAIVKIKIDSRKYGCLFLLTKTNWISYNVNYIRISDMNGGRKWQELGLIPIW